MLQHSSLNSRLDTYFRIWARYHVYGFGILFGWFILWYRTEGTHKFLSKSAIQRNGTILAMWAVCAAFLIMPVYMMAFCTKADLDNPDLYNVTHPEMKWNAITGCASNRVVICASG